MLGELKGKKVNVKLWIPAHEVESSALDQLRNVAALPWVEAVCAMPDVYTGAGATVGSVIAMNGAVAPAAVGVDPGCGMEAVPINLEPDRLRRKAEELLDAIEAYIPLGFESHQTSIVKQASLDIQKEGQELLGSLMELDRRVHGYASTASLQLGSLGGGNHFIEITEDTEGRAWLMLHSGSRRMGKEIADAHIKTAMHLEHNLAAGLPDKALSVFLSGTPEMDAYRHDLYWAQRYAALNRRLMMERLFQAITTLFPSVKPTGDMISCHHNYVAEETHDGKALFVTRKGAIRAGLGEMGIIPGAMSRRSYIVKGLGNVDALLSAPHGAGRKMSRSAAKKRFTKADIEEQTKRTMCRKDKSIIDELPGAYKNIKQVMEYSGDLVEIVAQLEPAIVCAKAYNKRGEHVDPGEVITE